MGIKKILAQKYKNIGRNKLDERVRATEIHKKIELNDQRGITVSLLRIKEKIKKDASINGMIKFIIHYGLFLLIFSFSVLNSLL